MQELGLPRSLQRAALLSLAGRVSAAPLFDGDEVAGAASALRGQVGAAHDGDHAPARLAQPRGAKGT